jgi:hypothetical protein
LFDLALEVEIFSSSTRAAHCLGERRYFRSIPT